MLSTTLLPRIVVRACVILMLLVGVASAQVPIPMQERIQRFNQLSTSEQQNALIRELQYQLPPTQRDAIVGMLRGQQQGQASDAEDEAEAQRARTPTPSAAIPAQPVPDRLRPRRTVLVALTAREEQIGVRSIRVFVLGDVNSLDSIW